MARKNGSRFLGFIFRILGFGGLATAGWITFNTFEFMDNSISVTGTVTSVEVIYGDDSVSYKPTFRFLDEEGNKQRATSSWSSSSYNYDRGERVEILYDWRNPQRIRVNSWFSIWGIGMIPGGIGLVLLLVSRLVRGRKRKEKRWKSEPAHEIRSTNTYAHQESRETAENHAREKITRPTVVRRRR